MTRISAADAPPPPQAGGFTPSWRFAEQGFTLIELLIVMTIVGLMSAVVVIAMPGNDAELRQGAESFAARVRAVQEQAVLGSRVTAVRVTPAGYSFERRTRGQWQALDSHRWPAGTRVAPEEARLIFDPTGSSDPARLVLERDGEQLLVEVAGDGRIDVRRPS